MTHPALDVESWTSAVQDSAVIVADGSNVKITVKDGQLVITDGVPGNVRERHVPRMPHTVDRVMVLGRHGLISLDALRWLSGTRTGITHVAEEVTMTSGAGYGDARIIRSQATRDPAIARYLITEKVRAQGQLLEDLLSWVDPIFEHHADKIESDSRIAIATIRGLEGDCAAAYWHAWSRVVEVPWSARDLAKVPAHWRSFPGRTTMRMEWETNRHATDPLNAMLNYVYRILETETLNACLAYGIHPDLGVMHADGTDRHAMVLDLMEPVRSFCDALVLRYLRSCAFDRRWCHEIRDGVCELDPPLTHVLAGWAMDIRAAIRPYAEEVRRMFLASAERKRQSRKGRA